MRIDYTGPESLEKNLKKTLSVIDHYYGISFSKNGPFEASMDYLLIDYDYIGFSDKGEYFERIDEIVDSLRSMENGFRILKSGKIKYSKEFKKKERELYAISSSTGVVRSITGRTQNTTAAMFDNVQGKIYVSPYILFSREIGSDSPILMTAHEMTHREVAMTIPDKEGKKEGCAWMNVMNYLKEKNGCLKYNQGGAEEKRIKEIQKNMNRILINRKKLKINTIDEGIAYAVQNPYIDPPIFRFYGGKIETKDDYERAFDMFKEALVFLPFKEAVNLARETINEAWTEKRNAIDILEEKIIEKGLACNSQFKLLEI